jgi:Aspartyl/Asparaginyl beta-hydroxylase
MPTQIIRKITEQEQAILKDELLQNESRFELHAKNLNHTMLRDGRSIHVNFIDDQLKLIRSRFDLFPKTHGILKDIAKDNVIGRCYWHRLLPKERILLHVDKFDIGFLVKDQLQTRYQIYLECPSASNLILDGKTDYAPNYENSLVDFDLRLPHSYRNDSEQSWYFLVFDVLRPGITLS